VLNYRANIVIFHEIAPLSARSSKKEDAKRGTGARELEEFFISSIDRPSTWAECVSQKPST